MSRTKYPKGIQRTEEILEVALRVVAEKGYSRATVRELAEEAGLSKTGLLHHFGSKEALFAEILRRRDAVDEVRMTEIVDSESGASLADLPRINEADPGLVQLYARFSAEASDPSHRAHAFFRERYERFRDRTADVLRRLQREGRLPAHLDADRVAAGLLAMLDGLQMQWLFDDRVEMAATIGAVLSGLGLDRKGEETAEDPRPPR